MKFFLSTLLLLLTLTSCGSNDSVFELDPNQSMLMTGKGPGQDGAINPYYGEKSIAVIRNIGDAVFSVRIQENEEILKVIEVSPGDKKEIPLEATHRLYLDTAEKSKLKLTFKKFKE